MRGHPTARWRDVETGRFVKTPKFYRYTWGIKGIPLEHVYYSATLFYWNFECDIDGEEILLRELEEKLGYLREVWWFSYAVGFGEQEVNFDERLVEKQEFEFKRFR